ncbi:unnamed protein product [Strongylus vulgaris]|uniref:Uncharacterized protein n=1 Tax=Strongylus vulgaris TaxID=40348 RepID=A0A3P7J2Y9_STRVU|nr:unnamed protein product [Strongylus vulgaris]
MDLDPYFVMFSSIPLVIQMKVNLTLTIAIAFERNLALFSPFLYRKLLSIYFATFSLFLGFLFAACDLMLEFASSPIVRVPNCPALGCFLQDDFRFYWGTSSMFMGSCIIILTTTILVKLRRVEKRLRVARIFLGKESRTCNSLAYLSLNSEMREFAKRLRREVELRLRGARISTVNFALK